MMQAMRERGFYEFFAGGGMARAGLGNGWKCLFANDFDPKKAEVYAANWGKAGLYVGDVASVAPFQLPGEADLAWASFPCQDLSLAGIGAGLKGDRSGAFWPFWRLLMQLRREGRAPRTIVLENVCGLLTSHRGEDFVSLCRAVSNGGYRMGAAVIDAVHFLPQSRPRLFVVGVRDDLTLPIELAGPTSSPLWHPPRLLDVYRKLPSPIQNKWIWFNLPRPPLRNSSLSGIVESDSEHLKWHSPIETQQLLEMMSPLHKAKVSDASRSGERTIGTVYKRTRREEGGKVQRAEVRFDEVAGCLRTPGGGSSRQVILVAHNGEVRTRLLSARETARLMGLPDDYELPGRYNDAYHLTGDGVVVPVVRFLAENVLEPVLDNQQEADIAAE